MLGSEPGDVGSNPAPEAQQIAGVAVLRLERETVRQLAYASLGMPL